MKKLLALILLSPLVVSETYSCTNELKVKKPWNKQVVYIRNGNEFISKQHNAFSIDKKNEMPMSQFNWEIYTEDEDGIFLVSQNGLIKRERVNDSDMNSMYLNIVFINKGYLKTPGYTEFDIDVLDGFKNIIQASGSCLIIKE